MGYFSDFPHSSPECLMCTSKAGGRQLWRSLAEMSNSLMLFPGLLPQLKMEMRLIGLFACANAGWSPWKSAHTGDVCSMENSDSPKLLGRWRMELAWHPSNRLSCSGLQSVWNWWRCHTSNFNVWQLNIVTGIWLQNGKDNGFTLGILCGSFPQYCELFTNGEDSERFQLFLYCLSFPLTSFSCFPNSQRIVWVLRT